MRPTTIGAVGAFLLEGALQVSGYQNIYIAFALGISGFLLLIPALKEAGSKILRRQKDEKQSEEISVQRREPTILPPSNTPILRAVPTQEDKPERVFLGENITPDYLIGLFDEPGRTTFQGETLVQPFIGEWMKLSGIMGDVSNDGKGIAIMTFRPSANPNLLHFTTNHMMLFRGEPIRRIIILKQGDTFTAIGQIYSVNRTQFVMDNCEILD